MKKAILALYNSDNNLFKLAGEAKRLPHIALSSFLLPVLFVFSAAAFTQFIAAPLFFGDPKLASSFARQAFGLYVLFSTAIALIFLWVKFYERRSFYTIGFTSHSFIKKYLWGFGTGMGMNVAVVGLMALFGTIELDTAGATATGVNAIGGVSIMLFGFIIQGASEEILARGWMFQVIGARYKPWLGAVISSVFFSLLHLGNSGINFFAVLNLVFFAILMTLYVMKDGSLWAACAWHTSWNWTMGNVLGLSVSGTEDKVSIFNLNTTGNEILSGGGFGPEGSVITTIVLLIAILWIASVILKKRV